MPTKPTTKTLDTSDGAKIVNAIRAESSPAFQAAVPYANGNIDNLREIGQVINSYQPLQNEFLKVLVNRIARVIITSKMYTNPWARFKKGILEYGETVEEIFVSLAKPHEFDQDVAEREVFRRELPNLLAAFHHMNFTKFYKTTISTQMLQTAFLSYQGISDLISRIVDSMYSGSNYDEFLTMKYMIARAALNGYLAPVEVPAVTPDNAKAIVTKIKGISNSLEFMSSKYNYAGVQNFVNKGNQILLINADFDAVIDVEVLASAFNMDKAEFMGQRVLVDSFSDLDNVRLGELFAEDPSYKPLTEEEITKLQAMPAVLVDADWFMIFDNRIEFTEQFNGQGLYWNYWLHNWKTFSFSPFATAIMFTTEATTVTDVTVTPAAVTIGTGDSTQLSAAVTGTGFAPTGVIWTLAGNESTDTTVTNAGVVNLGKRETAKTITVTATSVFDPTKSGSCVVTNSTVGE